jgi:hypothetical protein
MKCCGVWICLGLVALAAMRVEGQEAPLGGARPVYIMLYMHHYIGGGGFYPTAQDFRAFAELTQKYQVPATFFFDGILVERLQKEDPTIFNRLKVPLGYHGEETHGPPPVVGGRSGCVGYGKSWNEAVQAVMVLTRVRQARSLPCRAFRRMRCGRWTKRSQKSLTRW